MLALGEERGERAPLLLRLVKLRREAKGDRQDSILQPCK